MTQISYYFILLCFFYCIITFADKRVSTIIIPHSLSVNAARELAGWQNIIHSYSPNEYYGVFSLVPEATLTFRSERIAQCLFGDAIVACNNTFRIAGSRTENRADAEWLADYFGLPTDFESCVEVHPQISNILIDADCFVGLDKWIPGLYFRLHAPLVYSRWNLNLCESLISTGSNAYDPGYFNPTGIERAQLSRNFTSFIGGIDAPKATDLTFDNLAHAKMDCNAHHLVRLSEIQGAIGWNILHQPRYHLGGNFRFSIPTGNSPDAQFLFEPIIGNGHHWEVGGGLSCHVLVWEDHETQETAGLYFDCNITHLFASRQKRTFDLCANGNNSRYMLAQRMDSPIEAGLRGIVDGERIEPTVQYQKQVTPVANLTTLSVDVSSSVQADLAVMVGYTKGKNSWGFGYGFWGRSCETIRLCARTPFELMQWALKGDSSLFGFESDIFNTPIALSATQSNATINHGLNFIKTGAITSQQVENGKKNNGIDNPAPAVADTNNDMVFLPVRTIPGGTDQISTSIQPILLTREDIDINSARTQGQSHKIFSHFTHRIHAKETHPYLGIGAEIEFGKSATCNKAFKLGKPPCINTALSFWGVWIKGGIAF